MANSTIPSTRIGALVGAGAAFARCRTQREVLGCVEQILPKLVDASAYEVWWGSPGHIELLVGHGAPLEQPSAIGRTQIEDGQTLLEAGITYIPLIAVDHLRGWLAIVSNELVDQALSVWAHQAAGALVAVEAATGYRERAAIDEIARVLSGTLNLDLLLARVAETVGDLLDLQGFFVALVEENSRRLRLAYANVLEGEPSPADDWSIDEGLTGLVVRSGEPICTEDYLGECARRGITPKAAAGLGYSKAWLGVPLRHHDHTLGVIVVTHDDPAIRYEAADVQLLSTLAAQAAAAVANAQLYGKTDKALAAHIRDLEQRNQQLAEVVKIGNALRSTFSVEELCVQITQAINTITQSPVVVLGLVEAGRAELRVTAIVGGEQIGLRRDDRWITFGDLEHLLDRSTAVGAFTYFLRRHELVPHIENAALMAIRDPRGALAGAILLDAGDDPESLLGELVDTLEIIANQAGIAVNNALLYAEQQTTVDRLTALNALSLAVSTAQLPVEDIINMAIGGAVGTTGGIRGGAAVISEGRPPVYYGAGEDTSLAASIFERLGAIKGDYLELAGAQVPERVAREGIHQVLIVPLRGANLTSGALWIGYAQALVTQAEREMAVLYAKMAGAVLENMYLAEAVRSAHDRMASILASAREGMLLVSEDGRVAMANLAFVELLNIHGLPLVGRSITEICASPETEAVAEEFRLPLCQALNDIVNGTIREAEGDLRLPGALDRDLTWHVLPVRGTGVEAKGALLVIHDVTADRQMERMRQDLANMIVHDLRSPLTNMMVSVDLLLKRGTGPLTDPQARILAIASSSCQQMLDLVNALLDIRRLEHRTRDLQRQPVDLDVVAETVFERLERTAEDRRIRLVSAVAPEPQVEADPDMIRRVLQNLVDNAVKFSSSGATVTVRSRFPAENLPAGHPAGEWVVVEVQDQGIGIAEEFHQVIFELFAQAPEAHGHGTGLGLAFCKLAVEAHGGRIWLSSSLGQGATFRFTLPVAR